MAKNPAPKTTHATELNIWVLAHMRRCLKAGLLTVTTAKELQLTTAGIAAVNTLARTDAKVAAIATTEAA